MYKSLWQEEYSRFKELTESMNEVQRSRKDWQEKQLGTRLAEGPDQARSHGHLGPCLKKSSKSFLVSDMAILAVLKNHCHCNIENRL